MSSDIFMSSAASVISPSFPFLVLLRNTGADVHQHLTAEERDQLTRRWNDWVDRLVAEGKLQHGRPLGSEGRVVSGGRGERVTDGPFAETTEVVGGYLFLSAANIEEATEIARECPSLSLGSTIEVRPVVDSSPVLEGVRGRPPKSA